MRKFEIVVKELESAKLTIAEDRITLKLPVNMGTDERKRIEEATLKIDAEIGEIKYTIRGRFWGGRISLSPKGNCPELVRNYTY